jgi:glycosyltransferase involved in cell wall biosynthesis
MSSCKVVVATGIYPPDVGGTATYSRMLVEGLPHHGVEPVLLRFSAFLGLPRGLRHVLFLQRILTIGRRAEVLFSLDPVSVGLPMLLAAKILRRPLVLRVGGDYAWEQGVERFGVEEDLDQFLRKRYAWKVEWLRRIERLVARGAVRVIVPAQYFRTVLQHWGIWGDQVTVIHNAFDVSDVPGSQAEAQGRLGLQGRWVVSAGRLLRLKGFETLIEAFAGLKGDLPDVHLAILGSGPQYKVLAETIERAGLGESVRLVGAAPHPQVLMYMKAADLFVLNSAAEGMSNAIMEAMAVGTPVIATRAGGNSELIEDGKAGRLVSPSRPDELRGAMHHLLSHPDQARSLAEQARRSLARFAKDDMVRRTASALLAAR